MSAHRRAVPALLTVIALAAPLAEQAQAQSIWVPGSNRASASLEVLKPIPTREYDYWTAASTAFVLSGRTPIAENLMLIAELPFAHAGMKLSSLGGEGTRTNSVIGNPYVGIQYGSAASPAIADAGIRLPLRRSRDAYSDDFAAGVGILSDLDRMEAYVEDVLSVGGRIGVQQRMESGLVLRARGGPTLWYDTGATGADFDEVTELIVDYSAQAGYEAERFSLLGGLTGRTFVTGDGTFAERSLHQLGMSGIVTVGGVQPGITLRVPIGENASDAVQYVLGVHLTVPIGSGRN